MRQLFRNTKLKKKLILVILTAMMITLLPGCNNAEESADAANSGEGSENNGEVDYDAYIQQALNKVAKGSEEETGEEAEDVREVQVTRGTPLLTADTSYYADAGDTAEDDFMSGAEAPDAALYTPPQANENTAENGVTVTPESFEVGTCCIYIDGESDTGYAGNLITELNNIRTNMGYQPFNENASLSACADRRAREITCYLNHTRPNQTPFYSLAPQYFKAEMLAIDGADALDTVKAWIRDEYSRSIVFNTKYTSVGAACFKCNGLNCVVVAFGY